MTSHDWQKEISDLALENEDEAVAQALRLSQRVGNSPDPQVRLDAADALYACAKDLGVRGRSDAALRIAEELCTRFADDPFFRVQALVAAALSLMAELQVAAGQLAAAIAAYDEALSLVALSDELTRRGAGVALLLAKARVLTNDDRREEAIVVFDSALLAIQNATAGKAALRTRQAAVAVVAELDNLAALDRYADAYSLGEQLSGVLAHVPLGPPPQAATRSVASEPSESALAAALAEVVNEEECWAVFEGHKRLPSTEAAARACRLYGVSDPWALPGAADTPAHAASTIVRAVADGYALLAGRWSPAERSSLPLPQRALVGRHQVMGQPGLAEWATAHGHRLALHESDRGVPPAETRSPRSTRRPNVDAVSADLIRNIIKCLYLYELARVLGDSEPGLEALHHKLFRAISISYLRAALEWIRSLEIQEASDGRIGVAITCWLIAEGVFAITHDQTGSFVPLPPPEAPLRELLHNTGGYAWLRDRGVSLPAWTEQR